MTDANYKVITIAVLVKGDGMDPDVSDGVAHRVLDYIAADPDTIASEAVTDALSEKDRATFAAFLVEPGWIYVGQGEIEEARSCGCLLCQQVIAEGTEASHRVGYLDWRGVQESRTDALMATERRSGSCH